jgi:hypothetical protein
VNTVTHGLAPLLLAHACLRGRWSLSGRQLAIVGVLGAAPDLINPHLTLEARKASWSHGLPAWAVLTVVLVIVSLLWKRRCPPRLAVVGSLAYLLHLLCDAIAGGINWLSPVGDAFWGEYWFPVVLWTPTDVVLVLTCYFVFRAIPGLRRAREARELSQARDQGS